MSESVGGVLSANIGVFDSGIGGLTVVRALRNVLPECSIAYLGDTARLPFGTKSARTVERYSLACQRFLLARGVDLIMVACNTASATALTALEAHSPVPVIGAVEPGALSAIRASRGGRVGVIGTLATIASGAYERAIARLMQSTRVSTLACPLLVPLAEEGWTHDDVARAVAHRYLVQLFACDPHIDTLVLGCTHYPLLRDVLTEAANELATLSNSAAASVMVVDSATAMAEAALEALRARPPADSGPAGVANTSTSGQAGSLQVFATDTSRLSEVGPRFLGQPIQTFELVDV